MRVFQLQTKDFVFGAVDPEEARYIRAPKLSPVVKHGDHDQSTHGRRGAGQSLTAHQLNQTVEDVALQDFGIYPSEYESKANLLKKSVTKDLTSRLSDVSTEDLMGASGVTQQIIRTEDARTIDMRLEDGSIDTSRVFIRVEPDGTYGLEYAEKGALTDSLTDRGYVTIGSVEGEQLLREHCVSKMVQSWAVSSNANPTSLALQEAVKNRFGLQDAAGDEIAKDLTSPINLQKRDALLKDYGHVFTRFAEEQYNATQEWFKSRGISEITVSRGFRDVKADTEVGRAIATRFIGAQGAYRARPLSSWSASYFVANNFTNLPNSGRVSGIVETKVPISKIFATPFTGIGCLSEKEIVLLGGLLPIRVNDFKTHWAD